MTVRFLRSAVCAMLLAAAGTAAAADEVKFEFHGFVGASLLLGLYALLLWRAIRVAWLSKDPFGTYVAAGIASMFAIQMFVNVGMVIGIMPITGIPLPFVTHGGASLISLAGGLGILESIRIRQGRAEW